MASAGWLFGALKTKQEPSLKVLDCSVGKEARREFEERHIEGAMFFDLLECRDKSSPYEMMLPSPEQFADYVGGLGITNQSHVVIYDCDKGGMLSAPRLWWMFRFFGHSNVSLLDGGLVNWVKHGLPVTDETATVTPEKFNVTPNRSLLKTFEEIEENLSSGEFQLVDARAEQRFRGPEPKPGEGIEPGHIPGAVNLPYAGFLTDDGHHRPAHQIRQIFQEKGIDLSKPLAATCFRGVTACHLALATHLLGNRDTAVYDGSWSEWFHRAKPQHKEYERPTSRVTSAVGTTMASRALVTAGWLSGVLKVRKAPLLRVLDGTGGKDSKKEFAERHLAGASFFDLEECRDHASPYPMMLPSPEQFADYVGGLGVSNRSHVVIYDCDKGGAMCAPRLWWMFRVFGHSNVSLLDGGLVNWVKRGLPLTDETAAVKPEKFNFAPNRSLLKTFEEIQENLSRREFQLVDARGHGRFRGPEPKPGEGIEPGHIPGSVNIPFSSFLAQDGHHRPAREIRQIFQDKGIDLDKPLAATCFRGVTACHVALATHLLGKEDTAVYDGSWSEWFHRAKPEHKVYERPTSRG
ncbi:uncharacterized protein PAF06_013163 [Gastrophryne carolinensis]